MMNVFLRPVASRPLPVGLQFLGPGKHGKKRIVQRLREVIYV